MITDILPIVLAACVVILTIVLTIVGINLILVLAELKKTLAMANNTIDQANEVISITKNKIVAILNPFHSLSAFITNFTAGLKVAEGFMGWLSKNKTDTKVEAIEHDKNSSGRKKD